MPPVPSLRAFVPLAVLTGSPPATAGFSARVAPPAPPGTRRCEHLEAGMKVVFHVDAPGAVE